jgi:GNAT superfamily N-acetyltransferase
MPRLADFCNRNFQYHRGRFAEEPLRRTIFDDPDHRGEHGFLLLDGEDVVGVMVGVQRGDEAWLKFFVVDESRRRSGIASRMLGEIEGRFRATGVERVHTLNSSPYFVMPGLDVRYTEAFCLLQEHGYRLDKCVHNMEVDLGATDCNTSESESGLAAQGIAVRRMNHEYEPVLRPWIHRSWGHSWATEACNGLKNDPVTTYVALKGANIVGFATYDVMVLAGSFGPTGVEESVRGLGLGKVLLFKCLGDMKARGDRRCEIIWVGPIAYYAHTVGARICSTYMHATKVLQPE